MDVKVQLEGEHKPRTSMLVEPDPQPESTGLNLDKAYICLGEDGIAFLHLANPLEITHHLDQGSKLQPVSLIDEDVCVE